MILSSSCYQCLCWSPEVIKTRPQLKYNWSKVERGNLLQEYDWLTEVTIIIPTGVSVKLVYSRVHAASSQQGNRLTWRRLIRPPESGQLFIKKRKSVPFTCYGKETEHFLVCQSNPAAGMFLNSHISSRNVVCILFSRSS